MLKAVEMDDNGDWLRPLVRKGGPSPLLVKLNRASLFSLQLKCQGTISFGEGVQILFIHTKCQILHINIFNYISHINKLYN